MNLNPIAACYGRAYRPHGIVNYGSPCSMRGSIPKDLSRRTFRSAHSRDEVRIVVMSARPRRLTAREAYIVLDPNVRQYRHILSTHIMEVVWARPSWKSP